MSVIEAYPCFSFFILRYPIYKFYSKGNTEYNYS
jgi:hypothetical protein